MADNPTTHPWPNSMSRRDRLRLALGSPAGDIVPIEPANRAELQAVVEEGRRWKAFIPFGNASMMRSGNSVRSADVLVGTNNLREWVEYNPADLTVTVQAGLRFEEVQAELRRHHQFLPWDPPYAGSRTMGGLIACNSSGALACKYGPPRDRILGMEVILADGTPARCGGRVVKNVAGYDLGKLYAGSLGTLAILTEVCLKVSALPEAWATYLVPIDRLAKGLEQAEALQRARLAPCAADLIAGELPERPQARWTLALRVDGTEPGVAYQIEQAQKLWPGGILLSSDADGAFWDRMALRRGQTAAAPDGVALRLNGPLRLLEGAILFVQQWWNPVVRVHLLQSTAILTGAWSGRPADFHDWIARWRAQHGPLGGRLTVEEASAAMKTGLECFDLQDGLLPVLERIKNAYDPQRCLNPGRSAGAF